MTRGIKISCKNRRELYLFMKISNDPNFKCCFEMYSEILSNIITTAKNLHYKKLVSNSSNKIKATWNIIIKTVTS
jgi:hypothetical protein